MAPNTTKRNAITLAKKLKILSEVNKKKSYSEIGKMFGLSKTTISSIVSNQKKIEEAACSSKRKKIRTGKFHSVEEAVVKWIKIMRSKNVSIGGALVKTKAEEYAKLLKISEFRATNGWLDRFKQRNDLTFKNIMGEKADAPIEIANDWVENKLPSLIKNYTLNNVFNLDETALFFKLTPNKTLAFRNETCSGGKLSKERVSLLFGANADGTEKLPLLMIGKSAKPSCFKNIRSLPLQYVANRKSWMTSKIWEDYIRNLDKKFLKENRLVLFIADNCPSHSNVKSLKAIKLIFLPPNITSICQPMDQGVIKNVKHFYKQFLLLKIIRELESSIESSNKDVKITILDAVNFIAKSWEKVKSSTISNCFKKAGITGTSMGSENVVYSSTEEMEILWQNPIIQASINDNERVSLNEFLYVDELIETDETVSDDTIIERILEVPNPDESESDEEDVDILEPIPANADIIKSFRCLRTFLSYSDGTEVELQKLHQI